MPESIEASSSELANAVTQLSRLEDGSSAEAVLTVNGSRLEISIGGSSKDVQCTGSWSKTIRIHGNSLDMIARSIRLIGKPTIKLEIDGKHLKLGGAKIPYNTEAVPEPLSLPKDAPLLHKLRYFHQASEADIRRSGLGKVHANALAEKRKCIAAAAKCLKNLEIGEDEISGLIDQKLSQT